MHLPELGKPKLCVCFKDMTAALPHKQFSLLDGMVCHQSKSLVREPWPVCLLGTKQASAGNPAWDDHILSALVPQAGDNTSKAVKGHGEELLRLQWRHSICSLPTQLHLSLLPASGALKAPLVRKARKSLA